MRSFFVRAAIMLVAAVALTTAQESKQRTPPLSVEGILKLAEAGVSEDVIITRIKTHGKPFDLSDVELLELRRKGLSDTVLKYMLDPSAAYTPPVPTAAPPPAAPPPAAPPKKYPEDESAAKIPEAPGVYLLAGNELHRIEVKLLMPAKSGGGVFGVIRKGKVSGLLNGRAAKVRATAGSVTFYARLTEPANVEEVVLVALAVKGDRRELELSTKGGQKQKPGLKIEAMRQYDSLEVGSRLFRIAPQALERGEYLFYLVGSADPQKVIQGKGYDFGID